MPDMTIRIGGEWDVHRLGLGTIRITQHRGFGLARADAGDLLRKAVAEGINLFDTADSYGPHTAEKAICGALRPYKNVVVVTKGGMLHNTLDNWQVCRKRDWLRTACDGSLKRLGVDAIQLYLLHEPGDDLYPARLDELNRLQKAGKVRHVGVSNVTLEQLKLAMASLDQGVAAVQNFYSVYHPRNDDVLEHCERNGIPFIAHSPFAENPAVIRRDDLVQPLTDAARNHGCSVAQVMLAALLQRSPVIIPIPGTHTEQHLLENLAAGTITLTDHEMQAI